MRLKSLLIALFLCVVLAAGACATAPAPASERHWTPVLTRWVDLSHVGDPTYDEYAIRLPSDIGAQPIYECLQKTLRGPVHQGMTKPDLAFCLRRKAARQFYDAAKIARNCGDRASAKKLLALRAISFRAAEQIVSTGDENVHGDQYRYLSDAQADEWKVLLRTREICDRLPVKPKDDPPPPLSVETEPVGGPIFQCLRERDKAKLRSFVGRFVRTESGRYARSLAFARCLGEASVKLRAIAMVEGQCGKDTKRASVFAHAAESAAIAAFQVIIYEDDLRDDRFRHLQSAGLDEMRVWDAHPPTGWADCT